MRKTKEQLEKENNKLEKENEMYRSRLSYSERREKDLNEKLSENKLDAEKERLMTDCKFENLHEKIRFYENLIEANTKIKLKKDRGLKMRAHHFNF